MDQRLKKALEHADYVTTFKNQKRVLLEKFNKESTIYYEGGQYTATRELIASIKTIDSHIFIDNNNIPIRILNRGEFYNTLIDAYESALESYNKEYQKLVKSERTVQGILDV
jgi:hypothetical protein